MPQMMPLNWIFSLMIFISIFILFNIMNYYYFNLTKKSKKNKKYFIKKLNWKW